MTTTHPSPLVERPYSAAADNHLYSVNILAATACSLSIQKTTTTKQSLVHSLSKFNSLRTGRSSSNLQFANSINLMSGSNGELQGLTN